MATVVISVGGTNHRFVALACINIVVAANAGGAFSPFGDITTLMVWQKGMLQFTEFFALVVPSIVNWAVTAALSVTWASKGATRSRARGSALTTWCLGGCWLVHCHHFHGGIHA